MRSTDIILGGEYAVDGGYRGSRRSRVRALAKKVERPLLSDLRTRNDGLRVEYLDEDTGAGFDPPRHKVVTARRIVSTWPEEKKRRAAEVERQRKRKEERERKHRAIVAENKRIAKKVADSPIGNWVHRGGTTVNETLERSHERGWVSINIDRESLERLVDLLESESPDQEPTDLIYEPDSGLPFDAPDEDGAR
jgi:hypothetical protein